MSSGEGSQQVLGGEDAAAPKGYSDVVLACGVVAIVTLMILPLPLWVVDSLIAFNILMSVGLLLLAIYIPAPTAFSSFPSVILLSTLFRLSLSISITRLILLKADAGSIIQTFGHMVVGGNLVVGMVVFIIITLVQFIVIAKGAERVAEVAARFTLDAMPGKQLSIDSDLRAGLIDKNDARKRRRALELESQLHGSLDGAMKFVKGDAIAGIVILIVNILGGLTVGVLQRDLSLAAAVQTYSILTIGDGLVAQIPALLTSISAALIITRTASEEQDRHLGAAIARQVSAHPRVIQIGAGLALLLTLVPGFPWPVFMVLGLALLGLALWRLPNSPLRTWLGKAPQQDVSSLLQATPENAALSPPASMSLRVGSALAAAEGARLRASLQRLIERSREQLGVPIPQPRIHVDASLEAWGYRLQAHGFCLAQGCLKPGLRFAPLAAKSLIPPRPAVGARSEFVPALAGEWLPLEDAAASVPGMDCLALLEHHLQMALSRHLGSFLGIQETANLINLWNLEYPDLIKEMLRVVPPQRLTEVLRRLLQEGLSIRNLRDIFEAITDAGAREKDVWLLTEQVRIALRRQISDLYAGPGRRLQAILVHPQLEEALHQRVNNGATAAETATTPDLFQQTLNELRSVLEQLEVPVKGLVVLCSQEVRRYVRRLTEEEFFSLPVLSYQELTGDVEVVPVGQLRG